MHPDVPDSRCAYLSTPNLERLAAGGHQADADLDQADVGLQVRDALGAGALAAQHLAHELRAGALSTLVVGPQAELMHHHHLQQLLQVLLVGMTIGMMTRTARGHTGRPPGIASACASNASIA